MKISALCFLCFFPPGGVSFKQHLTEGLDVILLICLTENRPIEWKVCRLIYLFKLEMRVGFYEKEANLQVAKLNSDCVLKTCFGVC